ncbi:MAG TPA: tetratricopeptide repeat protein [Anaeromyxobacteraceae bacterium]
MPKTAHELTRKEMKGPDRFQVVAADAASWLGKHQRHVAMAAAAVVVAAVATAGISYLLESRREQAGGLLYRAIDAASGEISSVPLPNFDRPTYKTAEEKERAVLDAAAKVRDRHPGTRAATTAALLQGDAHLALGEWEKAIAAYQAYLAAAPPDDAVRFGGIDGLARAQEGKGDLDAAARTYEQASDIPFYKDRAALERSRVLAKAGKKDEAKKALEAIAKESPLQGEAQERLARLGAR